MPGVGCLFSCAVLRWEVFEVSVWSLTTDLSHLCCGEPIQSQMARKIVLISVLTVVAEEATTYLWTSFLTNFAALVLTLQCKPYTDPLLDRSVGLLAFQNALVQCTSTHEMF